VSPYAETFSDAYYRDIAQAWKTAQANLQETDPGALKAWRELCELGQLIDPRVFLFQDRRSVRDHFFCLNPALAIPAPMTPAAWIVTAIQKLAVYWHVSQDGLVCHAAGVERDQKGYLFLGPSGAGKSTVSSFSEQAHGVAIHDDQVMLGLDHGEYRLSAQGGFKSPVLRAIFVLQQSETDFLVPLAPLQVCAAIAHALVDYASQQKIPSAWIPRAFRNATTIARTVPGYKLHFRKSPDFWNVIDAELGR
jgi:hypothetical protein